MAQKMRSGNKRLTQEYSKIYCIHTYIHWNNAINIRVCFHYFASTSFNNAVFLLFQQQRPDLPRLLQQMHAQQLPAHAAPPIPMIPHPGLGAAPPSTAASILGLSSLGPGQHPLSMLATKPELHRSDDVKSNSGQYYIHINLRI